MLLSLLSASWNERTKRRDPKIGDEGQSSPEPDLPSSPPGRLTVKDDDALSPRTRCLCVIEKRCCHVRCWSIWRKLLSPPYVYYPSLICMCPYVTPCQQIEETGETSGRDNAVANPAVAFVFRERTRKITPSVSLGRSKAEVSNACLAARFLC